MPTASQCKCYILIENDCVINMCYHTSEKKVKEIIVQIIRNRTRLTLKQYPLGAIDYSNTYSEFQQPIQVLQFMKYMIAIFNLSLC